MGSRYPCSKAEHQASRSRNPMCSIPVADIQQEEAVG